MMKIQNPKFLSSRGGPGSSLNKDSEIYRFSNDCGLIIWEFSKLRRIFLISGPWNIEKSRNRPDRSEKRQTHLNWSSGFVQVSKNPLEDKCLTYDYNFTQKSFLNPNIFSRLDYNSRISCPICGSNPIYS